VAADVLTGCGAPVQLKWPNDLHAQGRKLGGVLVELQGEPAGQCVAVIGLGINLHMPRSAQGEIDQPWIDLRSLLGSEMPGRNRLAGTLVAALMRALPRFERKGFSGFRNAWGALDMFRDREVVLEGGPRPVRGRAAGIDADGALLIQQGDTLTRHLSGDVSLRVCE
jgi:BirA family biotin operon repressor/biotin-[acetyl-CoA-carboxylase] ligase